MMNTISNEALKELVILYKQFNVERKLELMDAQVSSYLRSMKTPSSIQMELRTINAFYKAKVVDAFSNLAEKTAVFNKTKAADILGTNLDENHKVFEDYAAYTNSFGNTLDIIRGEYAQRIEEALNRKKEG